MGKSENLIGKRFNRLVVIGLSEKTNRHQRYWKCICDCGNIVHTTSTKMKSGHTKSCGCWKIDKNISRTKRCDYKVDNNLVFVTLQTGEVMICDLSDWNNLKVYGWRCDKNGYAVASINGKLVKFHKAITFCEDGKVVDHINRNKLDNRKCNLRVVTQQVNTLNRGCSHKSYSRVKGVS